MNIRPYQPADKLACIEILKSNQPRYFADNELDDFVSFLNNLSSPYFCLVDAESIIGCGGYYIKEDSRSAGMTWGMIANHRHKEGLGKWLLLYRLAEICKVGQVERVLMNTSQHTYGFFEKIGFVVTHITPDGFGIGLDEVDMELVLTAETCQHLQSNLY